MARTKLAHGGLAFTGMEAKVEQLAIAAASKYKNPAEGAKAAARIRRQYYGYVDEKLGIKQPGFINIMSARMQKYEPSAYSHVAASVSPRVTASNSLMADLAKAESRGRSQYYYNTLFGIGRSWKSAKDSAEVFANAQDADTSPTSSLMKRSVFAITKGIQNAFGGKELTRLSRILGVPKGFAGAYGAAWMLQRYLQTTMASARYGASIGWSAGYTGSTVPEMAGVTGALSAFGGGGSSAARLYSMINAVKQGTLVGKKNPWTNAIMEYGLNLTVGGTDQWKSAEGIIEEISNRLAGLSPRAAADLAQSLGLDQSQFNLLRGGYENFKNRVRYANEGNPFANPRLAESFEYTTEQANILGNELNKLVANIAATDVVGTVTEFWADFFHAMNTDGLKYFKDGLRNFWEGLKNKAFPVDDYDTTLFKSLPTKAGYHWYDEGGGVGSRSEDRTKRYFEELFKYHRAPQIREKIYELMPGLDNPARDRWIENYDFFRKAYDRPTEGSAPIVNPNVTLDLGGIQLKPGGKEAISSVIVDNIDWGFAPTAIARV